jgi:hypothetical protein
MIQVSDGYTPEKSLIPANEIQTDSEYDLTNFESNRTSTLSDTTLILPDPLEFPPRVARPEWLDEARFTQFNCTPPIEAPITNPNYSIFNHGLATCGLATWMKG